MNRWMKHAFWAVSVWLLLACGASRQTSNTMDKKHKIDSLPATIIQPQIENPETEQNTDSTSSIGHQVPDMHTSIPYKPVSGPTAFKPIKKELLKIAPLSDIPFSDLGIVVVDNRNNDYLNQDF